MKNNIDISIVIVNYNVKDFLLQCLKSISNARKDLNVEVIVVDNDSSDGSIEYLTPLFPEVDFIEAKSNLGFGKANNIGIEKSTGKYLLILNPDTILAEDTLEVMVRFMDENPKTGIAGCKVLNPDGTFQVACRRGFPTPWVSFSKLFGLQKLFPKSKLFAQYNQLFKSVDETYNIDAVIGAFMFCRNDVIKKVNGFDTDFFMYGEDLDLCFRVSQEGWDITYLHTTSIIHFKGESTKRSTINEVKHFYEAMEIFSSKHFGKSIVLFSMIKIGIYLRAFLAYINKYRRDIFFIVTDLLSINISLLIGTKIRFGELLGFPDYAYPTVFFIISFVFFFSMLISGEYFEGKHTVRKTYLSLMISFFILSSLTYFFPDYRFSRGVLLMTVFFTTVSTAVSRGLVGLYDKTAGKERDRRILLAGSGSEIDDLLKAVENSGWKNLRIVGMVNTIKNTFIKSNIPVIGSLDTISSVIEHYKIHEVIIAGNDLSSSSLMRIMAGNTGPNVRFHLVNEYDELIASRIIKDISGTAPDVSKYNITIFRYKLFKRSFDLLFSFVMLTLGLPYIFILGKEKGFTFSNMMQVIKGKLSVIGVFSNNSESAKPGKIGITGLASISNPERLSQGAIANLNEFYLKHYSISLDFDILLKHFIRK